MTEILCRGQVDALNLFQLLAACQELQEPEESLLLTEQLPEHFVDAQERRNMLRFEIYGPEVDVTAYTSGRLFHNDFELRWEKQDALFRVVYLGSEQKKSRLDDFNLVEDTTFRDRLESETLEYREKKYYLFGEQIEEEIQEEHTETIHGKSFVELRIPRLLYYPVQSFSRYVQMVVREYIDKETGRVEYFRFQGLEPTVEE